MDQQRTKEKELAFIVLFVCLLLTTSSGVWSLVHIPFVILAIGWCEQK